MMCTQAEAPAGMSPNEQVRVWDAVGPLIEQAFGFVFDWLSIDQLTPEPLGPAGSGSDIVTPVAVPVPVAPEFDTVTVKPMFVPALTLVWSAVLVMLRFGPSTLMLAEAVTDGLLLAEAVAVFG